MKALALTLTSSISRKLEDCLTQLTKNAKAKAKSLKWDKIDGPDFTKNSQRDFKRGFTVMKVMLVMFNAAVV